MIYVMVYSQLSENCVVINPCMELIPLHMLILRLYLLTMLICKVLLSLIHINFVIIIMMAIVSFMVVPIVRTVHIVEAK